MPGGLQGWHTYRFFISLRHVISFNSGAFNDAPRTPSISENSASMTIYKTLSVSSIYHRVMVARDIHPAVMTLPVSPELSDVISLKKAIRNQEVRVVDALLTLIC